MAELAHETWVVGLIQRFDNAYLVCRAVGATGLPWDFPRGIWQSGESAEGAMRRVASEMLGMSIEVDVAMPPLSGVINDRPVVLRYHFCGVLGIAESFAAAVEQSWVGREALAGMSMHPLHRPVIDWLRQERG